MQTSRAASNYLPSEKVKLGSNEARVFNSNVSKGLGALNAAGIASKRTKDLWKGTFGYHNDNADAFRHSYWNALMSKNCGYAYAESFANAHEKDYPNVAPETTIDAFNNKVGRDIGVSKRYNLPNAMQISSAIEKDVLSAIKNGRMKRFVGSDLRSNTKNLVKTNSNGLK